MSQNRQISPRTLYRSIHRALKDYHSAETPTGFLVGLYLVQLALRREAGSLRQAINEVLLDGLKEMEAAHGTDADILRYRFLDIQPMQAVANRVNLAQSTANKRQRDAIKLLASIIWAREQEARKTRQALLEKRLELPPDIHLIGFGDYIDRLMKTLLDSDAPWLIAIEGLGGIGKTSLANAVVRQMALSGRYVDVAWVSAKQQEFLPSLGTVASDRPALDVETLVDSLLEQLESREALARSPQEKLASLTELLKRVPHLVVVDNLETVVDYQVLLPVLRKLAHPSKILLTSRHSLRAYSDVSCFVVNELSRDDTLAFLRYEAEVRRLEALAKASKAQLTSIHEVVGGNPLALKLVVGQIATLPLSQVLDSLKEARGKKIDDLYIFIYWQAWKNLEPASRQALLSMPLAQNGTRAQLAAVSELEDPELNQALDQLASLSLLEVSGTLEERRYRIHRLTETFLLNEVVKWQTTP